MKHPLGTKDVPCIILAGGLGTRLKSAVPDKPKCLAPVGDQSFLALLIKHLRAMGLRRFYLSLGHLAHLVIEEVENLPEPELIKYAIEHEPLGTGGGVLHTCSLFDEDEFFLINGDTWIEGNFEHLFVH
jgi:D-glycero-alpha-D-manno-heptose 1-phosphate guanylyltransferase